MLGTFEHALRRFAGLPLRNGDMLPSLLQCSGRRAVVIAAAMAGMAAPLAAQRFTCSEAASLLRSDSGARADLFDATNTTLSVWCRKNATAVIARMLRRARPNTVRDTLAFASAYYLRDERMLDSLSELVKESRQPTERRKSYMKLLALYANCASRVDDRPGWESRSSVVGFNGGDGCNVIYPLPLSPSVKKRARDRVDWMGAHDPDAQLRELSRRVAEDLALGPHYR
jgi:hypothetical protein